MSIYYEYDIRNAKLQVSGRSVDVATGIREVIILSSLSLPYPLVSVSFFQLITRQFQTKYQGLKMTINVWREQRKIEKTYFFDLVPFGTDTTIYMPDKSLYYTITKDREFIEFTPKACFKLANYEVGPVIEHNKKIEDIFMKNKDFFPKVKKSNLVQDFKGTPNPEKRSCKFSTKKIDQFFMPRIPFLKSLHYVQYWWGWYPGCTCCVILPEFDVNPAEDKGVEPRRGSVNKAYLLMVDFHKILNGQKPDNKIYIRDGDKDYEFWANDAGKRDFFAIVPTTITNHMSSILHEWDYVVINKPKDKLYHKLEKDIKKPLPLIEKHGAISGSADADRDNYGILKSTSVRFITNHTGYEKNYDHFTSNRTYDLMYAFRMHVRTVQPLAISSIYPGNIVDVRFSNPDKKKFGGRWIVESVLHRLTRERGREWQFWSDLTLVRSNLAGGGSGAGGGGGGGGGW